jgi:hypothetical protein
MLLKTLSEIEKQYNVASKFIFTRYKDSKTLFGGNSFLIFKGFELFSREKKCTIWMNRKLKKILITWDS